MFSIFSRPSKNVTYSLFIGITLLAVFVSALSDDAKPPARFKNVQILQNLSPREMNTIMQTMSNALGVKCDFCHDLKDFSAEIKKEYKTARIMLKMVNDINSNYLTWSNAPKLMCVSCHQGKPEPKIPLNRKSTK